MGIVRVFGGNAFLGESGGDAAFSLPKISFSGEMVSRVKEYGGALYAEYVMVSSGTLTIEEPVECDVYAVGSGGAGASAASTSSSNTQPSPGGGSGFEAYQTNVSLPAGYFDVSAEVFAPSVIALPTGALTAAKGGDASANSTASALGVGFEGTYHPYGDANVSAGDGGGATFGLPPANFVTPGRGGGGCNLLPNVLPEWGLQRVVSGSNYDWLPVRPPQTGFGAGAMGKTSRYIEAATSHIFALWEPKPCAGCVALRIKLLSINS